MTRVGALLAVFLACHLGAGCAATGFDAEGIARVAAQAEAGEFHVPRELEDAFGFDPLVSVAEGRTPRAGDRALFRVTAQIGGELRSWLLRVELEERVDMARLKASPNDPSLFPPLVVSTPRWRAGVLLHDAKLDRIERCELLVPEIAMRENLFYAAIEAERMAELAEAAEAAEAVGGGVDSAPGVFRSPEVFRVVAMGVSSTLALFEGWQANETLAGLLKQVVGTPPLAAVLRGALSFDTTLTLSTDLNVRPEVTERVDGAGPLAAYWVPFRLLYAGSTLMSLETLVVEPRPPLSVGVGLISMRGVGSNPEQWVRVDLVGARLSLQ